MLRKQSQRLHPYIFWIIFLQGANPITLMFVFIIQVTELKQNVTESAETIASLRKTTMIMLGIIIILQLILTYQVMSCNPGSATNDENVPSLNIEKTPEHKEL